LRAHQTRVRLLPPRSDPGAEQIYKQECAAGRRTAHRHLRPFQYLRFSAGRRRGGSARLLVDAFSGMGLNLPALAPDYWAGSRRMGRRLRQKTAVERRNVARSGRRPRCRGSLVDDYRRFGGQADVVVPRAVCGLVSVKLSRIASVFGEGGQSEPPEGRASGRDDIGQPTRMTIFPKCCADCRCR
jgi:hypothetical protein